MKKSLSGALTGASITSPLPPLLLLVSLLLGVLSILSMPREEEPQIVVPLVDIHVTAEGLKAPDAVELVTKPLEAIVKGIDDIDHVYSQTVDDHVMVTVRFKTGTDADDAILRIHEKLRANSGDIPVGIQDPLIVGRGINDVAILTLTLSPRPEFADRWGSESLYQIAEELRNELIKTEGIGLTYIIGGAPGQIRVEPDPEKLALYGVTLQQLVAKVREANRSFTPGRVQMSDQSVSVVAGQTLSGIPDIGHLLLTTRGGRPVYVQDVAATVIGPAPVDRRVWHLAPDAIGKWTPVPAVTLAFAKRGGANAVVISDRLLAAAESLKGSLIPADITVSVTRDYGKTADEKANELLFHLGLATVSIVLLVGFVIGRREGLVVFIIIPMTILLTLFASNLMGYTINRVSLFALIFSIGILVDDAIVVIENISRHWADLRGRTRIEAAVEAVAEVGNPTIVATLTVVVALLPMLFVSGLMGPYMEPIPVNASVAMLFSFFVAILITPWLMLKIAPPREGFSHDSDRSGGWAGTLYRRMAMPVIRSRAGAFRFLLIVGGATLVSLLAFATKTVTVKLLPFDNKSEIQVVVDLPEGASLEATERVLKDAAGRLQDLPELVSMQVYAGTAAPFNFNGLVRHFYLRTTPELGDLQVNILPKDERSRASHAIALDIRKRLSNLPVPDGTSVKVVEVPPGPPVMSTLLAEIYGPDAETRRAIAAKVETIFREVPFIVDVDNSIGKPAPRLRLAIDQDQLEFYGVQQDDVYDTISALLEGVTVGYSHRGEGRNPVEITVRLPHSDLSWSERLASTPVPADTLPGNRTVVELGDVIRATMEAGSPRIFRRDGRFVDMVTAELAGSYEAPIYGMMAVDSRIKAADWGNLSPPVIRMAGQPEDESHPTLLWDGEWEVTFVTFRDMGMAFGIALLGIYVLVVAQFKSFKLPLLVLVPVPLTLVGIVMGHMLLGATFSATSMIGFIALAGIIVRNSILLIDFIQNRRGQGTPLRQVLIDAGSIRFRPIALTALSAMIGAAVILFDPIFQGLAISLLFGLASSTLLTVLVIPAIYICLRDDGKIL